MILTKINSIHSYYLSNDEKPIGDILVTGSIVDILTYVNTTLIVNAEDVPPPVIYVDEDGNSFTINSPLVATDFQLDAEFAYLGAYGYVSTDSKWFAIKLSDTLYQIILTKGLRTVVLPFRPTWTGSLPDLIGFIYGQFAA